MLKFFRIGQYVFVAIGLGLMLIGFILAYRTTQFKKSAIMVPGTVVELIEKVSHSDEGTSIVYVPRVAFRTAEGQESVFISDTGSNPPGFRPGETVEVMYRPGDPYDARINTFWQLYLAPVICIGIGSVFFLISLFVFTLVRHYLSEDAPQQTRSVRFGAHRAAYGKRPA